MPRRLSIQFQETKKPICEPVTKFGGQPMWLTAPQWPLSKETGRPMRFICQIALDPSLFPGTPAKMAYLFMTDPEAEEDYIDGTWEPDGGENAVILQPGETAVPVAPNQTGPSLQKFVKKFLRKNLQPEACEFAVTTVESEDPEFAEEDIRTGWSEEAWGKYAQTLDGNKIGGTPIFIQDTEFPGPGKWQLILQLDSAQVPFSINFGDSGIGYAFLSEDGKTAKFLWQCS